MGRLLVRIQPLHSNTYSARVVHGKSRDIMAIVKQGFESLDRLKVFPSSVTLARLTVYQQGGGEYPPVGKYNYGCRDCLVWSPACHAGCSDGFEFHYSRQSLTRDRTVR